MLFFKVIFQTLTVGKETQPQPRATSANFSHIWDARLFVKHSAEVTPCRVFDCATNLAAQQCENSQGHEN